ncbi:hypothetical protein [Streptomyces sp. NPDC101455]|uniref:hypothetical protein n=1 Tax=Streptomyces sp. NPDC101455 TaxID=3366142 RepID=UPI00382254A9
MTPSLGPRQKYLLQTLTSGSVPSASWTPRSAWRYGTASTTIRILDSLSQRSLVSKTISDGHPLYTATPAGFVAAGRSLRPTD